MNPSWGTHCFYGPRVDNQMNACGESLIGTN